MKTLLVGYTAADLFERGKHGKKVTASGLDDNNEITDGDLTALHLTDDYVFCHYGEDDLHDARLLQKLRYQLGDRVTVHPIGMDDVLVL